MASIKITELTDIGANIAIDTLVPVVNMASTPTTEKANLQIVGNLILSGAGGANFVVANRANSVVISTISSNTQILYNDGNVMAGHANLTFNKSTNKFTTPGNISAFGARINLGANAESISLLAPTMVAVANNNAYVQASLFNEARTGSSDFIAYGEGGTDAAGWNDIGFAGPEFNDANYSITSPGDGYIFTQTYSGNNHNGNLVIATGENSTSGDIIFATGGFTTGHDKARITGAGKVLVGYSTSQDTSKLQVNGNITAANVKTNGVFSASPFTINTGTTWSFGTDGNLSWPSPSGSWHIGTDATTTAFEIYSTTGAVVAVDTGAGYKEFEFNPDGSFHTDGNVFIGGQRLNVGPGADNLSLTGPTVVAATSNPVYVQSVVYNFDPAGSSDMATTGADGTDTEGYNDLGFNGKTFNQAEYGVTTAGDAYIFAQTYSGGLYGGNLVLATGNHATVGDIIFATGSFAAGADKARVTGAGKLLVGYSTSQNTSIIQANGNVSANSAVLSGVVKTGVFTTSTLPPAATAGAGARAFVTDATATTFASAYTGGAGNAVPVYSDGSAWYIG